MMTSTHTSYCGPPKIAVGLSPFVKKLSATLATHAEDKARVSDLENITDKWRRALEMDFIKRTDEIATKFMRLLQMPPWTAER